MEKLLHKNVILKSKLDGKIIGFYQEKKELPLQYLIEYWANGEKKSNWYYLEDFITID